MKSNNEDLLKEALSLYAGDYILDKVLKEGHDAFELGGETKYLTLFAFRFYNLSDVIDTFSNDPKEFIQFLYRYYSYMFDIIHSYNGIIENINSNEALAIFGIKNENHENEAIESAIGCHDAMEKLNNYYSKYNLNLSINIGITSGHTILCNIGSKNRLFNIAMGNDVDFCMRLMAANTHYNKNLLISESTYNNIKRKNIFNIIDDLKIVGREGTFPIYSLI